jgi:hypothetical protein
LSAAPAVEGKAMLLFFISVSMARSFITGDVIITHVVIPL